MKLITTLRSVLGLGLMCLSYVTSAQVMVRKNVSPEVLVRNVFADPYGSIELSRIEYSGSADALGFFRDSNQTTGIEQGLIISTGNVQQAFSPNTTGNTGEDLKYPGWEEINEHFNDRSFDVSILEFDIVPATEELAFRYVFASEEFPEYIGLRNDAFVMFLSGPGIDGKKNIALLPDETPVCVNNINPLKNAGYFIANAPTGDTDYHRFGIEISEEEYDPERMFRLTFDGFTTVLAAQARVEPYKKYHLQIAIGDIGDPEYDSAVLLEAFSLHAKKEAIRVPVNRLAGLCNQLDSLGAELQFNSDSSVASFDLHIRFAFNSTDINAMYYPALDSIHSLLKANFNTSLIIIGHTDNTGNESYNYQLSLERAKQIAYYLISKGINLRRIDYKGYGSTQPIANNNTEEGRARNRRVSFVLQNYNP